MTQEGEVGHDGGLPVGRDAAAAGQAGPRPVPAAAGRRGRRHQAGGVRRRVGPLRSLAAGRARPGPGTRHDGRGAVRTGRTRRPGAGAAGLVHAAGVHRVDLGEETEAGAISRVPGGAEVVGFASWREGLVVRPGTSVRGLDDIARQGLRLVNREPGAQARALLDRERRRLRLDPAELPGYETRASGHLQVAAAIVGGLADAGVSSEPAALAYGLDFIPLAQERFDLLLSAKYAASREVQGLLKVLTSPWLLAQLASLPGYDAARCGERPA